MKENNLVNAKYYCILLQVLDKVMTKITSEVYEIENQHRGKKEYLTEIKDVLNAARDLMNMMDPKYHIEYLLESSLYTNNILNKTLTASINRDFCDSNMRIKGASKTLLNEESQVINDLTRLTLPYIENLAPAANFMKNMRIIVSVQIF